MRLRLLEERDAPLMLEWMHDLSVVGNLKADFTKKTLADCKEFIYKAQNTRDDLHMAVADDNDEYMGTVSLKHIKHKSAEFGIVIRKKAMGAGYSVYAMKEILRVAFEELHLDKVFWCVSPMNKRALHFYGKNGYRQIDGKTIDIYEGYSGEEVEMYLWYQVERTGSTNDVKEGSFYEK